MGLYAATLIFALLFVYHGYQNLFGKWKGEAQYLNLARKTQHLRYWRRERASRGRLQDFKIGVECPSNYNFELHREGRQSRFAKWIGVSRERQVNIPEFDEVVYIASEHAPVAQAFETSERLHLLITQLLEPPKQKEAAIRARSIHLHRGKLWLSFVGDQKDIPPDLARSVVPSLLEVAERLPRVIATQDVFHWLKLAILALNASVFSYGLFRLFWFFTERDYLVDVWGFLWFSLIFSTLAIAATSVLLLGIMRRSSRTHLVFLDFFVTGLAGIVMSTYFHLSDANTRLDQSPTVQQQVEVRDLYVRHGRRNSKRYYLKTNNWLNGRSDSTTYRISAGTYERLSGAQRAVLQLGGGYFGYQWIRRIDRLE